MATEPTADGVPTLGIGTNADLLLRRIGARVTRRRARQIAIRDGHPLMSAMRGTGVGDPGGGPKASAPVQPGDHVGRWSGA